MKKLSLFLLALLCTGALLPAAAELPAAPAAAPALSTLPSPACASVSSASVAPAPSLPDFMVPEKSDAACSVNVLCRCGQRLSCTSATGNCQKVVGCSVTCDFNEQDCPPCHGFACF